MSITAILGAALTTAQAAGLGLILLLALFGITFWIVIDEQHREEEVDEWSER